MKGHLAESRMACVSKATVACIFHLYHLIFALQMALCLVIIFRGLDEQTETQFCKVYRTIDSPCMSPAHSCPVVTSPIPDRQWARRWGLQVYLARPY